MAQKVASPISRRLFLKTAGATALAAGAGPAIIIPGRAQPKTLKILRQQAAVPANNSWFLEIATAWGKHNGVEVFVDSIGSGNIDTQIAAEAAAQQGHDIVIYTNPLAHYEDQVINHNELYQETKHRYGKAYDIAVKSTHNRKTGKYHSYFK